ncbi:hypothetical protein ACRQ1B_28440 [Rhizobium panacihumi]|uniref:hypothetical protein n=1 Tax=Rhizobium panacihumi TaxID=2008450 RepID=UPI003D799830
MHPTDKTNPGDDLRYQLVLVLGEGDVPVFAAIARRVNGLIGEGWMPLGAPIIERLLDGHTQVTQAMVRPN